MKRTSGTGMRGDGRKGMLWTRKAVVLLVMTWFLAAGLAPLMALASDGADTTNGQTSGRSELIVAEGKLHNVTGTQDYDTVIVRDTGVLNVVKGATLNAKEVRSEGGSFIIAGTVKVSDGPEGGACEFHGRGPYLDVTKDGAIQIVGPPSGNTLETSQGGKAILDFMADDYISIKGEITATGNTGATATEPWTMNGLSGYASSGGPADIYLRTKSLPGSYIYIGGSNAKITASGGMGGDAADGEGTASGGYSDGGIVDGNVGAGGEVNITISGYKVDISNARITANGGKGGNAGQGADGSGTSGGGGGGFAGGGVVSGGTGGVGVAGKVGAGGWVDVDVFATTEAYIYDTVISGSGGAGGSAGDGGRGGSGTTGGGGGGGGYGGGGGAAGGGSTVHGEGTAVVGLVGSGGHVNYHFDAGDMIALAGDTSLTMNGGRGGMAGSGGSGPGGAGGGGGYGGGGGSSGWSAIGGSTLVGGRVGDGGDVVVDFNEYTISVGKAVEFWLAGGQAGNGDADQGDPGTRSNTGGQGAGAATTDGKVSYQIPKVAPYLKSPSEGQIISSNPTFSWNPVHDAGPSPAIQVDGYELEVSDNYTFDSENLVVFEDGGKTFSTFTPPPLPGGQYWWRVKSLYGSETVSSPKRTFYYNKPPNLKKNLPPIRVNEDENKSHVLNLDEYFTDDLYPDSMTYGIVEEIGVYHEVTLSVEGERNQWLNLNVSEDFFGQEYFNISATDEKGLTGYSGTVSVIILPVNDAPEIDTIEDQLVTEDEESIIFLSELLFDQESWNPLTYSGDSIYQISNIDVWTDSDYITVVKDPDVYPPTIDLLIEYTEEVGTEYVNLTVSDGWAQTTKQIIFNVSAENDPPVLSTIPNIKLKEDTPKTIDLKKYVYDEEDPIENLTWKIRTQDRRLLDFEVEEGGLLRLVPKAELHGQTKIYFTVTDSQNAFDSTDAIVDVQEINDPPRLIVDHLYVPKGVEMDLDLRDIMEDVDSPVNDFEILDVLMVNESSAVNQSGLTTVTFNYPDNTRSNDTLTIQSSDGLNLTTQNLTILLGYAPVLKKIKRMTFYEDEHHTMDLSKYVSDKDDNKTDLEWDVSGFDPSFIDPEINPKTGKLDMKAFKSGSGNFTVTVMDESGFVVSREVKVTVEPVTAATFLKRNPGILGGIIGIIALIVVVVVLVVTSKKFGVPFKGMKEKDDTAPTPEDQPEAPDGQPPPPDGWVDGEGWTEPPPDVPPDGTPEDAPKPPDGEAKPGPEPPPTDGKPGPKLVPPPVPVTAKTDDDKAGPEKAVKKCPRCKEELPPGAKNCPMCGVPTDKESRKRMRELKRKERRGELSEEEEDELAKLEEGEAAPGTEAKPSEDGPKCPECGDPIEADFIKCPSCNATLK
jgi:hypothetical protein